MLIEQMQQVLLPVLMAESEADNQLVTIDVTSTPDEEWTVGDQAEAYVGHSVVDMMGLEFHQFDIEYKKSLEEDATAFKRMIAHELVHVAQTLRGDEFNYELPYEEQPHEIEAYDLQDWLVFYYNTK